MKTILISGGSGKIGGVLTALLLAKGYNVRHLSRTPSTNGKVPSFAFDPKADVVDPKALEGVSAIVHLAGAPVDNRWTPSYKQEIYDSRILGTRTLVKALETFPNAVEVIVSASAVGIYPNDFEKLYDESGPYSDDFLGTVVQHWEREAALATKLGIRSVQLRTGVVLSESGGALEPIVKTIKAFVGAPLGSGKQYMPWIHVADMAAMYLHAIENSKMEGPYNAAAPVSVTNATLTKAVAKVLGKPLILPNVPTFALKLLLGEMSQIALMSTNISVEKLQAAGFTFKHPELEGALQHLLLNK
ncbi:MAG: TIGR01777 family oxidoreductase [Schleiferiaceae bacterium]|nr:TIGR01777 family oxidoreductase [Schleiferiaceae bacterium]